MRILMMVATLYIPVVTIAYGLTWLLPPKAADGRIHTEEILEGRFDVAVIGGVFMALVDLSSMLSSIGIVNGVGLGWFQLLVLAAAMTVIAVVVASVACSASQGGPHHRDAISPYKTPQHGASQHGNPQYGKRQQQTSAAGASVPFGHSAPSARDMGSTMPQRQDAQASEGFPTYSVPAGSATSTGIPRPDGTTPAAQGTNAGPRPAATRPTQPHAGWMTPPSASGPRQWTPRPMPTHRPHAVSSRTDLAITGLLTLVAAAVLAGIYMVDKGPAIPFIAAQTVEQTITRIISIGGGVCLIIVDLSLATAALRDRSAGWLTALPIIGPVFAIPTAAIGTEGTQEVNQHISTAVGNIGKQTMLDRRADRVSGGNPTGSTTLDLTGTPVGTSKTITIDWQAWSRLTIQMVEGQLVQIVCQPNIGTLSTSMEGNGQTASLNNCSGVMITSPTWGESSLGGITILITDEADIGTLTIIRSPDSSGTWGSASTPTSSVTPGVTPTPSTTPTDSQPDS